MVHDAILDFIGYGRPGYEFLSYAEDALFPFETSPFRRRSGHHALYNMSVYNVYQEPAVPAYEYRAKRKSKPLDIVDPVTGEKLRFPIK
jgi:hypothetical protein